jgi:uncharacterized membrane protein (DUF4010 family)
MVGYFYLQSKKKQPIADEEDKKQEYESPFQLLPAIQFAGLIVIIKYLSILGDVYKNSVPPALSNYFLGLIS